MTNLVRVTHELLNSKGSYSFRVRRSGFDEFISPPIFSLNPLMELAKHIRSHWPDIGERDLMMSEYLEMSSQEDARWLRTREMAAYKVFRKLVPYLEHKTAKSLFVAARTTTAEAFRRGAEFGRKYPRT